MTFIVGLTGGIGSGKSKASEFFASHNIDIIDTDQVSHTVTQPQGVAIQPIKEAFGDVYITAEGALDRAKMRERVFSDDESRKKLEAILHPLIQQEVSHQIKLTQSPYAIIVVPLLVETGSYRDKIQRILVIDCDEAQQISRTMIRSKLDEQTVRDIMAIQAFRQERLTHADDVITNNQDLTFLQKQVDDLHKKYLALASEPLK